ncbi:MAG: archaeosortase/exosortase family protein [Bacteroidetes bacterium]|nr:archaeosortase/exosortase family protein [Bacteroidota bacterium]
MLASVKQNKFLYFLLKAGVLYTLCYVLYEFLIKPYTLLDERFIRSIINQCIFLFSLLGYKTFASAETNDVQVFGIDGSNGVWIGGPCNGITLIFLFAVFIVAYPGNIKNKLWFIPLGILLVHLINLLRIISLALIAFYAPEYLNFNHTYTFTFLAYSFVFGLWMLWVNKYANPAAKP